MLYDCAYKANFIVHQDGGTSTDPLQLMSSIQEYEKGHQHGGYNFSVFGDSSFYGDRKHNHAPTMLLVCVESDEL